MNMFSGGCLAQEQLQLLLPFYGLPLKVAAGRIHKYSMGRAAAPDVKCLGKEGQPDDGVI